MPDVPVTLKDGTKLIERGPAAGAWVDDAVAPKPPLSEGQSIGAAVSQSIDPSPAGTTTVFSLPAILVLSIADRAKEAGLELTLPDDVRAKVAQTKVHQLSSAYTIHDPERGTFVRALARLALTDDANAKRPWLAWLDFTMDNMGALVQSAIERTAAVREEKRRTLVRPLLNPAVPRWAGSVSYAPVIARAREIATARPMYEIDDAIPARQMLSVTDASLLDDAHVVRVEPEQVAVLPHWESPQEAYDYAAEATLPFNPMYLDFEGVGGIPVPVTGGDWITGSGPLNMSGALVWRREGDDGALLIAPVGWTENSVADATPFGFSRYDTCGWFVFGENMVVSEPPGMSERAKQMRQFNYPDGSPHLLGYVNVALEGMSDKSGFAVGIRGEAATVTDHLAPLPGYGILPIDDRSMTALARWAYEHNGAIREAAAGHISDHVLAWGGLVYRLACTALAALSIMEAAEVVLDDAPMERRDRKRADKRGWNIAQQVYIRPIRRYKDRNDPSGESARYSHRFWRRATVAHYPVGTRMADSRPDLVTLCNREGAASCGLCRKVKHPATIIGPEDKPLVLKTLRRRRDAS